MAGLVPAITISEPAFRPTEARMGTAFALRP